MPYRIYAVDTHNNTVTRMDLNPQHKPITDRREAEQMAEAYAATRGHGVWKPKIEYYSEDRRTANPNWDPTTGGVWGKNIPRTAKKTR
jgi:hypothetical protein